MRTRRRNSLNSYIPEELVKGILARLPVKTLLKFRIVCKSWTSLIDSPDLVFQHLKLYSPNSGNSRLLLCQERIRRNNCTFSICQSDTLRKSDNEIAKFPLPFTVFQSLNGLMLILQTYNEEPRLKLWNPSIRKCLIIPECPLECQYHPAFFKLGFAASINNNDDYKVFAIRHKKIAVYSVKDHCWRVDDTPYTVIDEVIFGFRPPVSYKGVLYWQSTTQVRYIYCLNVKDEELGILQVPDAVNSDLTSSIFVLGESLAIFSMGSDSSCIWVLEMNDNHHQWSLWHTGQHNADAFQLFLPYPSPILYFQRSNTLLTVQKGIARDRVVSYNYITHEIRHLGKALNGRMSIDAYIETLVLQKGVRGQTLLPCP